MSQDDFNAGALVSFIWILTVGLSIGSGILAWNWIEPESFLGAIGFLIVWGVLSKIGHFIAFSILMGMFGRT